jgi:DNA polymerase-3 subunit chi
LNTVEFYSGIQDPLHHTLRLLRKAHAKGARVAVVADGATLRQLDARLWTADERDFVPHVRVEDADAQRVPSPRMDRTPLWLVESPRLARRCDVLVNLGKAAVDDLEGYARVIDLVGTAPDDRQAGRVRWRRYQDMGYTIEHRALDAGIDSAAADADPESTR